MKLMLLRHGRQGMQRYTLEGWRWYAVLFVVLVGLPAMAALGAYQWTRAHSVDAGMAHASLRAMQAELEQAKAHVRDAQRQARLQIDELTKRLGVLQAEVLRINAVGKRLLDMAGVNPDEFDFDSVPAVGGPENGTSESLTSDRLDKVLRDAESTIREKEHLLSILESVLVHRELDIERYISGRPTTRGWNSSQYGKRIDPFTGNAAWHEGMDFAGNLGDPIVATAAGVVSFVGEKWGYGLTVEVNHGNGIVTRYGHNKDVLVKPGQVVDKGQQIATMGSSGRSTGPHVHYEVLLNGKAVDPKRYVQRRSKG
jgi:murein DD-endopeptidase MepM/ murein hydrolase activator NlpD